MNFLQRNTIFKVLTLILTIGLLFTIIGCTGEPDDKIDPIDTIDDTVLVTGITMESAEDAVTITSLDGTLQLSVTIMPDNATDKNVTWSVVDGTGSATISQTGLLTAVTDGTVTVKAISDSVTSLDDELVITISGQDADNSAPLATAVLDANTNIDATMVGTSSDDFVPEVEWVLATDHDLYAAAIVDAELILASTTLTETEVTDAVAALALATDAFNLSKQDGTKLVMNINLGSAENFVILSKTGVSTTGVTAITGNIGISPANASYLTGFNLIMDGGGEFSTSALVTGQIYAADYALDTPTMLTTAIEDVLIAYNDGAGRTADYTELFTGDLSGQTLDKGVYKWSSDVLINSDLTLNGNNTDVFIFQIAGTLTMGAETEIILTGGLLPENIYWVVADTVAIGVGSAFQGVILATTNVTMNTGSSIVGMIYAQTSVSLAATTVVKP